MVQVPSWLNETAKKYWKQHVKHVSLTEANKETFAVLAQTYADYREAAEYVQKKTWLAEYVRLAKLFGLVGKKEKEEAEADELDSLMGDDV